MEIEYDRDWVWGGGSQMMGRRGGRYVVAI
jgi:hypothetical protein